MPPDTRERRDVVISYRLTAAEATHIDAAAAKMTPSRTRQDWCRAAALHAARIKVPKPPPPRRNPPRRNPARRLPKADVRALAEVLAQLGKIGSNLNQIARRVNATERLPDGPGLREALDEVTAAARQVRAALEGRGDDDGNQG